MKYIFMAFYIFFIIVLFRSPSTSSIMDNNIVVVDSKIIEMYRMSKLVERANMLYVAEEIVKFENRRKIR